MQCALSDRISPPKCSSLEESISESTRLSPQSPIWANESPRLGEHLSMLVLASSFMPVLFRSPFALLFLCDHVNITFACRQCARHTRSVARPCGRGSFLQAVSGTNDSDCSNHGSSKRRVHCLFLRLRPSLVQSKPHS